MKKQKWHTRYNLALGGESPTCILHEGIHTPPRTRAIEVSNALTTDRDSLRYTYNATRRVRQLALGCESNWVKSIHDAYENTWKCGELKLYFSPSAGGYKKKKKKSNAFCKAQFVSKSFWVDLTAQLYYVFFHVYIYMKKNCTERRVTIRWCVCRWQKKQRKKKNNDIVYCEQMTKWRALLWYRVREGDGYYCCTYV